MKTTKKWSKMLLGGMAAKATLVAVLAFGLVLSGCDGGDSGGGSGGGGSGNTDPKSITITGITGVTDSMFVVVMSSIEVAGGGVASGRGTIASGTLTVALKNRDGTAWTGSGSYYVTPQTESTMYVYTNGKTLAELGINPTILADLTKLPKLSITSASTSVAFNKFVVFASE